MEFSVFVGFHFFVSLLSCGINLAETEMENGNESCCTEAYGQCQGPRMMADSCVVVLLFCPYILRSLI